MGLEPVHVSRGMSVCEADEMRDLLDEPGLVGDGAVGVVLDSGECDGAVLYGDDVDEVIAAMECAVANLRAVKAQREQGTPLKRPASGPLAVVVEPTEAQRKYVADLVSRANEVRCAEWSTGPDGGEPRSENDRC